VTITLIPGGHVTTPRGFRAGAVAAGIKTTPGVLDLALLASERDCSAAGVFTRNLVRSAPVGVTEARAAAGRLRAVVVNSGNANALTGEQGVRDAEEMASLAAAHLAVPPEFVAVASTGVTGVTLPLDKVRAGIPSIVITEDGGPSFARAIMTTDTVPKEVAVSVDGSSGRYSIGGCAKGSGMIHPNMGTMLAYVTTDAAVEPGFLRSLLRETADATLNMVTIDGDTSCSDTLLVFANGVAGQPAIREGSADAALFGEALLAVCTHLARAIARDGEGAGHLIEVEVTGAETLAGARKMARTVALSSLVKTAVAGCDPNWGRIIVAAGRSDAPIDPARATLSMQGRVLYDRGRILPFDEGEMRKKLGAEEVKIAVDLALGNAAATAWGCDLTTDYVHINADYRT
jgi:glutamate N-acetyltransferase/amino-acid N-acetyltransferase